MLTPTERDRLLKALKAYQTARGAHNPRWPGTVYDYQKCSRELLDLFAKAGDAKTRAMYECARAHGFGDLVRVGGDTEIRASGVHLPKGAKVSG